MFQRTCLRQTLDPRQISSLLLTEERQCLRNSFAVFQFSSSSISSSINHQLLLSFAWKICPIYVVFHFLLVLIIILVPKFPLEHPHWIHYPSILSSLFFSIPKKIHKSPFLTFHKRCFWSILKYFVNLFLTLKLTLFLRTVTVKAILPLGALSSFPLQGQYTLSFTINITNIKWGTRNPWNSQHFCCHPTHRRFSVT